MLKPAITQATTVIKSAMEQVRGVVGAQAPKPATKLSTKQQLDLFTSMTDSDFEELRAAKGDEAFNQYVNAMTKLARNE